MNLRLLTYCQLIRSTQPFNFFSIAKKKYECNGESHFHWQHLCELLLCYSHRTAQWWAVISFSSDWREEKIIAHDLIMRLSDGKQTRESETVLEEKNPINLWQLNVLCNPLNLNLKIVFIRFISSRALQHINALFRELVSGGSCAHVQVFPIVLFIDE